MPRLVPVLCFALLATNAAVAQTAPEPASQDLWCGTAFTVAFNVANAPPGTSEAELEEGRQLSAAGVRLIERGAAAYLAAGFTLEAVEQTKAGLVSHVTTQIQSAETDYAFEECLELIDTLEPAAARPWWEL